MLQYLTAMYFTLEKVLRNVIFRVGPVGNPYSSSGIYKWLCGIGHWDKWCVADDCSASISTRNTLPLVILMPE